MKSKHAIFREITVYSCVFIHMFCQLNVLVSGCMRRMGENHMNITCHLKLVLRDEQSISMAFPGARKKKKNTCNENKYFYEHEDCFDKSISFNYHKIKSKGSMAPAKGTLSFVFCKRSLTFCILDP